MLGLLLKQRLWVVRNRLVKGPHPFRNVLGGAIGTIFMVSFVALAGLNAGHLAQQVARTDAQAATEVLPVLLVGASVMTLVTSLSSAFHHLFLAGDLELLLASPAPNRDLFGLKVLEIWRDSLHISLFQAAALIGYGQSLSLAWSYYPLAVLCALLLTVGASALGALLTLGLARIRFGESVLGLSRLLAVALFLPVGALGIPALGFGRGRTSLLAGQDTVQSAASALRDLGPPPSWAPTTWAAHVLLGDEAALLSGLLLAVTAVLVFALVKQGYDALFQVAWERVHFGGREARGSFARRAGVGVRRYGVGPSWLAGRGPVVGVLQKDWRVLVRDPRWRGGLVVSILALALPAMVLFTGDPFVRSGHSFRFWFGMLPVPYLAYLFGSQQGAATLAYEGRNIALLRAAPVGMGRLVAAKVLGGLMLVLTVTWLATLALAVVHDGAPLEIGAALLAATWLALGATVAAVVGTALTADFESDNPQRRVGWLGTVITSALSFFFFASNIGLMVWLAVRIGMNVPRPFAVWLPVLDWGLPLIALLSMAAMAIAARSGMRRLAAWELS